jgi:hypothetical protein
VADERVRVEIGFEGGQVIGLLVTPDSVDELERALAGGDSRVVHLEAEDGPVQVVSARVAYLKRFVRAGRVGFGTG